MTQISYELGKNYFTIKVEGHADRKPGEDENLCCAAISTLTQTTLQMLYEMEESKELKNLSYVRESGNIRIHARGRGSQSRKLQHYAQMMVTGLAMIACRYPYTVKFVG